MILVTLSACTPSEVDSEGLLEDHGVHITWRTVSSKAEIAKTVDDVFSFIGFDSLEYVRMMAAYQICTFIDSKTAKGHLIGIGNCFGSHCPSGRSQL